MSLLCRVAQSGLKILGVGLLSCSSLQGTWAKGRVWLQDVEQLRRYHENPKSLLYGGDTVLGRITCPVLTRRNLKQRMSEPLVLRSSSLDPDRKLWELGLRKGLFWWSGKQVRPEDVRDFLVKQLANIVDKKGAGLWRLPRFKVEIPKPTTIHIQWDELPVFGPYIFNEVALFRPTSAGFECAGHYALPQLAGVSEQQLSVMLQKNPGYRFSRPDIVVSKSRALDANTKPFASALTVMFEREDQAIARRCDYLFDHGYAWLVTPVDKNMLSADNPRRAYVGQLLDRARTHFRGKSAEPKSEHKKTTGVDGKGALHQVAKDESSAGLSSWLTGPSKPEASMKNGAGALHIASDDAAAAKVFFDLFLMFGVRTHLTDASVADVQVRRLEVHWPTVDYLTRFHSRSSASLFPKHPHKHLDKDLEAFALAATQAKLSGLSERQIRHRVEEAFGAVIMRPKAFCIAHKNAKHRGRLAKRRLSTRHPDWFRKAYLY